MNAAESGVEITLAITVAVVLKMNEPIDGSAVSSVVTIAVSPTRAPSTIPTRIAPRKNDAERPPPPAADEPAGAAERLPALDPFCQQHRDGDREADLEIDPRDDQQDRIRAQR